MTTTGEMTGAQALKMLRHTAKREPAGAAFLVAAVELLKAVAADVDVDDLPKVIEAMEIAQRATPPDNQPGQKYSYEIPALVPQMAWRGIAQRLEAIKL